MAHLWLFLTLISAATLAASDALTKRAIGRHHDEYLVMWLRTAIPLPFLLAVLLFTPTPDMGPGFLQVFSISLVLEIIATVLYTKALKFSPLSMTLPFLSLTPVFLLVIPYLLLGEKLSLSGVAGILLISAGSYTLNLSDLRQGILGPLHAIRRERGALCMMGVALIYSFTSTLGKQGITLSSPLFFAATYYSTLVVAMAPIAFSQGRSIADIGRNGLLRSMLLPGILNTVMLVTHMLAMNLSGVAYMIAVKRTSLLFGVLFGRFLFNEGRFRERLVGVALMVAGVVMIVLD